MADKPTAAAGISPPVMTQAPKTRPPSVRTRRTELPLAQYPYWDKESVVNGALLSLERGLFQAPAQLCDAALRDDRAHGVLHTRLNGLLGTPIDFKPARDTARCRKIAEVTERCWPRMFPASELCDLHRWGLLLNLGVGQLLTTDDNGLWLPRLQTWHPQWAYFDWNHRQYRLATQDAGTVFLPKTDEQVNSDGSWVVYTPYGFRGWMRAPIRALARLVLMRGWTYRDYARYCELRGNGIIKAKVPGAASVDQKDGFFQDLNNLGNEPVIEIVVDERGNTVWDVEIIEAEANTYEGFEKFIAKIDASIAILLNGHNTTSEISQGGSYAAAKVGEGVLAGIRRFDGETLGATLHQQVLYHFTQWNFGDGRDAAIPMYQTTPEGVDKGEAEALRTLADAAVKFRQAGAPVDLRELLRQRNVPLLEDGEVPPPLPAPPAGGQTPRDGAED